MLFASNVNWIDSYQNTSWSHVKEIPGTRLLVSLHHLGYESANLELFDVSKRKQERKIYSFETVYGSK